MKLNTKGCKPDGDVCMAHHRPLICRHGCEEAFPHRCGGYESIASAQDDQLVVNGRGPDQRRGQ